MKTQSPLKLRFEDIPWDATYKNKNFRPSALSLDVIEKHINLIIKWSKPKKSDLVLDVGCGKGYLPHKLALHAKVVVGLDVNSNYIKYAKQNHRYPNVAYIVGDAMHLPIKDESFDIIVCREVIEHVIDPAVILQETRRVMRGKAIISTPNLLHFGRLIRSIFWMLRKKGESKIPSGHLRQYTYDGFRKVLSKNGFEIRRMRGTYFSVPLAARTRAKLAKFKLFRQVYVSFCFIMAHIFPRFSNYLTAYIIKRKTFDAHTPTIFGAYLDHTVDRGRGLCVSEFLRNDTL